MAVQLTQWISISLGSSDWPEAWADQWFHQEALLSGELNSQCEWPLDWMIHLGGPVRQRAESLVRRWAQNEAGRVVRPRELIAWVSMPLDPVIEYERKSWVREFNEDTKNVQVRIQHRDDLVSNTSKWEEEVLGFNHPFSELLAEFHLALRPYRFEPPWLYWARFPLWLKKQSTLGRAVDRQKLNELDEKLVSLRTLLSPQNELEESQSLEAGEIKLNPTLDVVQSTKLLGICRQPKLDTLILQKREFDELDALIVDEIRESFRIRELDLVQRLRVAGAAERITQLYELGFILRRAQEASP